MTFTLPDKITDEEAKKVYIQNIIDLVTDHTMVIFIDDSAQDNPGPGEAEMSLKNKVFKVLQLNFQRQSLPMALAMQMNLKP